MYYLLFLGIAFCISYFVLAIVLSYFFEQKFPQFSAKRAVRSILITAILAFITFQGSFFFIHDRFWADRALHVFGGGLLSIIVCWLVVRDTNIRINKFQFFVMGALVATGLGVANELLELLLQQLGWLVSAHTVTDTWLDLLSNTIGIALGLAIFTPLLKRRD